MVVGPPGSAAPALPGAPLVGRTRRDPVDDPASQLVEGERRERAVRRIISNASCAEMPRQAARAPLSTAHASPQHHGATAIPARAMFGAADGLVGGVAFGIMMPVWTMLPMIAMLVHSTSTSASASASAAVAAAAWSVHLARGPQLRQCRCDRYLGPVEGSRRGSRRSAWQCATVLPCPGSP
ncbi:hypothetical protein ACIQ9Q_24860 [Streptomyces sp. NPDC094438]|uniref:hypothetical protein n=1 Tax=Streptomyces sp. NPDC094438 TaxID=3366061 RepID=UPI00381A0078